MKSVFFYGLFMDEDLEVLYGERSLLDYIPLRVVTTDMQGKSIEAISYILPMEKVSGSNRGYANSLAIAAKKMGLPKDYIREIRALT